VSLWEVCAAVLVAALVPCGAVCLLAGAGSALAALEVAGTVTTTALMVLSQLFDRQPFIDLAVISALLTIVGALAFARLMEQDL
jgi:multisubunit Na+/H+ antiporter MnhF subunit